MRLRTLIIVFFVVLGASKGFAQTAPADVNTNAVLRARYFYNFIKYVEWPAGSNKGSFVIGILGNTPVFQELIKMAEQQNTRNKDNQAYQPLLIKKYSNVDAVETCNIIYIVNEESDKLSSMIKKTKGSHTLIITDKPGLIKSGSNINFIFADNKQQFELNESDLKQRGLNVSSSLAKFAILVI